MLSSGTPANSRSVRPRIKRRKLEIMRRMQSEGGVGGGTKQQIKRHPHPVNATGYSLSSPARSLRNPRQAKESNSGGNQKWFRSTCLMDSLANSQPDIDWSCLFSTLLGQEHHIPFPNTLMCHVLDTYKHNYPESLASNKDPCVNLLHACFIQVF